MLSTPLPWLPSSMKTLASFSESSSPLYPKALQVLSADQSNTLAAEFVDDCTFSDHLPPPQHSLRGISETLSSSETAPALTSHPHHLILSSPSSSFTPVPSLKHSPASPRSLSQCYHHFLYVFELPPILSFFCIWPRSHSSSYNSLKILLSPWRPFCLPLPGKAPQIYIHLCLRRPVLLENMAQLGIWAWC